MPIPIGPNDPQKLDPRVPPIPETVGATSAPVLLGKGRTDISFAIYEPAGPSLRRVDTVRRRMLLKFENITSDLEAPGFTIYLNLPPRDDPEKHPELRVGVLSMFGLIEASHPTERHPDNGLNFVKDITDLFHRLAATREWDPKSVRVSIVPWPWDGPIQVQVGRVSLIIQ